MRDRAERVSARLYVLALLERGRADSLTPMGGRYYEEERVCEECGERFWGTTKANFCGAACRCRTWRKQRSMMGAVNVAALCAEVLRRRSGAQPYSKLYPRLFRALAAELRKSGWDPIELLMTLPDEPATDGDTDAPGGMEGAAPTRRRWLHPPDMEIEMLTARIRERTEQGRSTVWHEERIKQLRQVLEAQS